MRSNDTGTFEADPGETIRFEVRRPSPPCVADFADDGWASSSDVSEPDSTTEVKTCVAPTTIGARCSMAITVSFSPDVNGDNDVYTVIFGGNIQDEFNPPPKINGNVYKFHVSQP